MREKCKTQLQLILVTGAEFDSPVETPIYSLGFPLTQRSLSIFSPGITKMPYNYYMHSSLQNTMWHTSDASLIKNRVQR